MTEVARDLRNRQMAALITAAIVALLFLILFFVIAFDLSGPKGNGMGVELNFGLDMQGSGDIQPDPPAISASAEEPVEKQEKQQQVQETTVKEEPVDPIDQDKVVTSTNEESPVAVKETDAKTPEKSEKDAKIDDKNVKGQKAPEQVVNQQALYKGNTKGTGISHGDDKGKAGDKGNPDGALDKNALYGTPGGGGGGDGSSLSMAGWVWDSKPNPKIPDSELGGVLKFQVKVDGDGEIIDIKMLESGVSAETAQVFKQAIGKLTFTKTGSNVPQISTGIITIKVRSR